MNKAVFLDRDGTINIEKNYVYQIKDFELIDGAVEGLRLLQEAGYLLVMITNQSGIARGYYTEEDYYALTDWMQKELLREGIVISGIYFCPHLEKGIVPRYAAACGCRKPKTGLFHRAIAELKIDADKSFAVGDNIRDISICFETGVKGILIGGDTEALNGTEAAVVPDLFSAAQYIVTSSGSID